MKEPYATRRAGSIADDGAAGKPPAFRRASWRLFASITFLSCVAWAFGCSSAEGGSSSSGAKGGYANLVRFGGITYQQDDFPPEGATVPREAVDSGSEFARVESRLEGPASAIEDGEAAWLEPGTPMHAVEGYDPRFRIAARCPERTETHPSPCSGGEEEEEEEWVLYEASENPEARRGGDLLDVGGKVGFVGLRNSDAPPNDPGGSAAVEDPERVAALVTAVLDAPVEPTLNDRVPTDDAIGSERFYEVVFYLEDGTATGGEYAAGSGRLSFPRSGGSSTAIAAPEELQEIVEQGFE